MIKVAVEDGTAKTLCIEANETAFEVCRKLVVKNRFEDSPFWCGGFVCFCSKAQTQALTHTQTHTHTHILSLSLLSCLVLSCLVLGMQQDPYVCYVHSRADDVVGVVVTDGDYPQRVAFTLIHKVIDDFKTTWLDKLLTKEYEKKAYEHNDEKMDDEI